LQLSSEKTIFMQKAIYYVSKILAARGIVELTDRCLYFQVSSLDASFGIRDVSIELLSITDVRIIGGDFHPRLVVECGEKTYDFVLPQAQKLYDYLKEIIRNPFDFDEDSAGSEVYCPNCGRKVDRLYKYCPWCGTSIEDKS